MPEAALGRGAFEKIKQVAASVIVLLCVVGLIAWALSRPSVPPAPGVQALPAQVTPESARMSSIEVEATPFTEGTQQGHDGAREQEPSALPFEAMATAEIAPPEVLESVKQPATNALGGLPVPSAESTKTRPVKTIEPSAIKLAPALPSKKQAEETKAVEPKAIVLDATNTDPAKTTATKTPAKSEAAVAAAQPLPSKAGSAPGSSEPSGKLVGPVTEQPAKLVGVQPDDGARKITIVDIPSDGSYVLLTNPKTRLPQKFVVGQKLATGETLQKIDVGKGTITLDGRTVNLE